MSRIESDHSKRKDSQGEAHRDAPAPMGSNADAAASAAHIAELVRRTAEREAAPSPSTVARPDVMAQHLPTPAPAPTPAVTQHLPTPAPTVKQGFTPPPAPPAARPTRFTMPAPSRRTLIAAGAVVALLIGGGVALSQTFGSDAGPTSPTLANTAPAGYAVQVTDVITDCAEHARGRTKDSFETQNCVKATRLLATGQVGGRPVLFVASRIEMASAEEAASIKQVLDGSATGNLNDLLREDKTFAGAPDEMPSSGYASVQSGKLVTVAEAGFIDDGESSNKDAALRSAASQVAAMVSAGPAASVKSQ